MRFRALLLCVNAKRRISCGPRLWAPAERVAFAPSEQRTTKAGATTMTRRRTSAGRSCWNPSHNYSHSLNSPKGCLEPMHLIPRIYRLLPCCVHQNDHSSTVVTSYPPGSGNQCRAHRPTVDRSVERCASPCTYDKFVDVTTLDAPFTGCHVMRPARGQPSLGSHMTRPPDELPGIPPMLYASLRHVVRMYA